MLHACAARFDVIFWGENFWELNAAKNVTNETYLWGVFPVVYMCESVFG
jgi:hypothetical protein